MKLEKELERDRGPERKAPQAKLQEVLGDLLVLGAGASRQWKSLCWKQTWAFGI